MKKLRIGIADNNGGKFTKDLCEYWSIRHEVKFERGASEYLAQWADIYFVDSWDNNIHYLYKLYHADRGVSRTPDWDNSRKPKIIVRALDWEVWIGLMRDQMMIDWVDQIVFIAPHIQKRVESEVDLKGKGVLIRPGVNLEKFTLKEKETDGLQLGMVLGDMWKYKNHIAGLDIFAQLYKKDERWRLHIRGQHENSSYDPIDFEYYLESRGIKDVVTLYPQVEDMNEWYENIDVLLHPGRKEAFCYAVGEAMAKGIPVVVNDFYGSRDIWPEHLLYKTHNEAVELLWLIRMYSDRQGYRKFIQDNYSLENMSKEFDKLL